MAITLTQTGRTATSVTFSISGIANQWSQRQTWIWNTIRREWVTLQTACSEGLISSYSAEGDPNGSITVTANRQYAAEYKVWQFRVQEMLDGTTVSSSNVLNTILKFKFEKSARKSPDAPLDITVKDLQNFNFFGSYIDSWINNGQGSYWILDSVSSGDPILADYLYLPAEHIYNAASAINSSNFPYREGVKAFARKVLDNVYSGAIVTADCFNGLMNAINNFNLNC